MIEGLKRPPGRPLANDFVLKDSDVLLEDRVPTEQFKLLVLRHGSKLSYEQIAAAQNIPLGTVRSRIHRGRAAILKLRAAAAAGAKVS